MAPVVMQWHAESSVSNELLAGLDAVLLHGAATGHGQKVTSVGVAPVVMQWHTQCSVSNELLAGLDEVIVTAANLRLHLP